MTRDARDKRRRASGAGSSGAALAGVLIVLATAGAVSATVLLQVDDSINILETTRGPHEIDIPEIDRRPTRARRRR